MKTFFAFTKKEITEQIRSGRITVLCLLFVMIGIMNPAVAKLTPWLLESLADSLAESGMIITEVTVSAMDSWVQFFKNVPVCLIAFAVMQSSVFTKEYASGTLLLTLTKGLERYKVVLSKAVVLFVLWTAGYWLSFGITYGYNAYFWDNSVAHSLMFSVVIWWFFGIFVICLAVLFSVMFSSNSGVLCATLSVVVLCYVAGLLPKVKDYVPTLLMNGNPLIYGASQPEDYLKAVAVTGAISVICIAASLPIFNKKQL